MKKTELKEQIAKLEKAVKSSFTPDALKPDMKEKLQELKKELENMEKPEKEEVTKKEESKQTSKESMEKQEVKKPDPEKAKIPKAEGEKISEKKKRIKPKFKIGQQITYKNGKGVWVIEKITDIDNTDYYLEGKSIDNPEKGMIYTASIPFGNTFFKPYEESAKTASSSKTEKKEKSDLVKPLFKKGQQVSTLLDDGSRSYCKIIDIDPEFYYIHVVKGGKENDKVIKDPIKIPVKISVGNVEFEAYEKPNETTETTETKEKAIKEEKKEISKPNETSKASEKKEVKPARKTRRAMKKEDVPGCEVVLNELAVIVNKYKEGTTTTSQKKPTTRKKVQHQFGTKLKKGINLDVGRAVTNRIKKAGGVEKLNIEKFERDYQKVEETAEEFVKALVKLSRNAATKSQEKSMADALVGELKERFQNIKDKYEKKAEASKQAVGRHSA